MGALLVSSDADIDADDRRRHAALHMAVFWRHGAIVRRLLAAGADPSARRRIFRTTLLMDAASVRDADTVSAVLSSGKAGDVSAEE